MSTVIYSVMTSKTLVFANVSIKNNPSLLDKAKELEEIPSNAKLQKIDGDLTTHFIYSWYYQESIGR